jgi:hypothetical protein
VLFVAWDGRNENWRFGGEGWEREVSVLPQDESEKCTSTSNLRVFFLLLLLLHCLLPAGGRRNSEGVAALCFTSLLIRIRSQDGNTQGTN